MRTGRIYCLRCLATLAKEKRCSACGYRNVGVTRRTYWNQVPWIMALETALKIGVIGLTIVGLYGAFQLVVASTDRNGYVFAIPILVGIMLWRTVSVLTKRMPYFSPVVFWLAFIVLAGLFLASIAGLSDEVMVLERRLVLGAVAVLAIAWLFRMWKRWLIA